MGCDVGLLWNWSRLKSGAGYDQGRFSNSCGESTNAVDSHLGCRNLRMPSTRAEKSHRLTGERMNQLAARWLPPVRIIHLYPEQRLRVTT